MLDTRGSGILMHISSLPSPHGIGTLGRAAYDFADFLSEAGQKYWQILPVGPTGCSNSPYQSFSTFAGNPYFIDLDLLRQMGLLQRSEYAYLDWGGEEARVDYGKIYNLRFKVLRRAYKRAKKKYPSELEAFRAENAAWLEDYAAFMALKTKYNMLPWNTWDSCAKGDLVNLSDEVGFWCFVQQEFFRQYSTLKEYVNEKGIRIIGDIPIYVAYDSADVWANGEYFELGPGKKPRYVAGCPPDAFCSGGQLWGNPVYNWARMKKDGYRWWIERIRAARRLYDVIRLDHFRGFADYWAVPYGDKTAASGKWRRGPGMVLFRAVKRALGEIDIIAEDLGHLTPDVHKLREETGFPGMKVLQFAFNPWENSVYLPHNCDKNCVVYTGTHDNNTARGFFETESEEVVNFAKKYMNAHGSLSWALIRTAYASTANTAIAQMQDFLELGTSARMNTPSTLDGNWEWRAQKRHFTKALAHKIRDLAELYGR